MVGRGFRKAFEGYILQMRAYAAYRMLHTICFKILKCPKIDHINFRSFSYFKIDHVLCSRNGPGKGPKMNIFVFWAFQDFGAYHMLHMHSRAKYILKMLFRAFQGTLRIGF